MKVRTSIFKGIALLLLFGCKTGSAGQLSSDGGDALAAKLAADPFRPQFHLLPAKNWMNDPTGPIYVKGGYHLFFQYNPGDAIWGDMHWAHATSPDMIHWQHEPVAIGPTPGTYDANGVFSGHIVVDENGTPNMFYTGVSDAKNKDDVTLHDGVHPWVEVQARAVSHDNLMTWQKDPVPVLPRPPFAPKDISGWRDPVVWSQGDEYMMIVGSGLLGKGPMVLQYRSSDLRNWSYVGVLAEGVGTGMKTVDPVDNEEMWECPDFFKLGDRYVLVYGARRKVFWKSGSLVAGKFVAEKQGEVDYGSFYASRSMLDKDGGRILWGWIPETRKDPELKAAGWAGLMALPRLLTMAPDGMLKIDPAPVVNTLRAGHVQIDMGLNTAAELLAKTRIADLAADIVVELAPGQKQSFTLQLVSEKNQPFAVISYNPANVGAEVKINTTTGSLSAMGGDPVRLRFILDGSTIEAFLNSESVITERVYVDPQGPLKLVLQNNAAIRAIDLWQMNPISNDRLTKGP